MKIVEINTVDFGSTGRIMLQVAQCARKYGDEVQTYSIARRKRSSPPKGHKFYSTYLEYCVHYVLGKLTGGNGLFSVWSTIRLICDIQKINPDIVQLHNLHGFSVNLPILFHFLKKTNVHVVWTLHDCWTFTGHCPHYISIGCNKWESGCYACPLYKDYPEADIDNAKLMWKLKRKLFTSITNMVLVVPSKWLAQETRSSFLSCYPVRVIHNGIDLQVFNQNASKEVKVRIGVNEEKHIVLGVSYVWNYKKGIDIFLELASTLDEDYQIVLVGTDEKIDKQLPGSIISIHRTQNQAELAEIYSAADVFVNPTREEVLGMVNIEALACGTPVVTFDAGGSPETIDETCGVVVPCDDVKAMENAIRRVVEEKPFSHEACRKRAEQFDMNEKFAEYVELYHEICSGV